MKYQLIDHYLPEFDHLAGHPLQSWWWGEFKKKRGIKVIRLAAVEKGEIRNIYQFFIHRLPLGQSLIYYPRGGWLGISDLLVLKRLAVKNKAFMVKVEPYLEDNKKVRGFFTELESKFPFKPSPQPLFPKYTLRLDLTKGEKKIWSDLHPKTRYNIRLAQRKGVKIVADTSKKGVQDFIELMVKTNRRHHFVSHGPDYYFDLFQAFKGRGVIKIFKAVYEGKTIASWWLFDWHDYLFYPYGASDYQYRRLMASNLLAWQAIKYGLERRKKIFDLWGAAPPTADSTHPWFGFTRFKLSYGASYWSTIGSWDLILNQPKYILFNLANSLRKFYLKKLRFI